MPSKFRTRPSSARTQRRSILIVEQKPQADAEILDELAAMDEALCVVTPHNRATFEPRIHALRKGADALRAQATVFLLTEETNTGDSEHDTVVLGVFATRSAADEALDNAIDNAEAEGKEVLGGNPKADGWDVDFEITAWPVRSSGLP